MPMRPDSPCALVPGTARFATRRAFGSPLSNTRRLPTRSDTSIRPSGRNATSHGRESPLCTTSSRIVGTFGTGVGDGDAVRAGAVVAAPVPDGDPAGAAGEGEGAATGAHAEMTNAIARAAGLTRPLSPLVRGDEDPCRKHVQADDVRAREIARPKDGDALVETTERCVELVAVRRDREIHHDADERGLLTDRDALVLEVDDQDAALVPGVEPVLAGRDGERGHVEGQPDAVDHGVLLGIDDVDETTDRMAVFARALTDEDIHARARAVHRHRRGRAVEGDRVRRAATEVQVEEVEPALGADEDVIVLVRRRDPAGLLRVREELAAAGVRVDLLSSGATHHERGDTVAVRRDPSVPDRRLERAHGPDACVPHRQLLAVEGVERVSVALERDRRSTYSRVGRARRARQSGDDGPIPGESEDLHLLGRAAHGRRVRVDGAARLLPAVALDERIGVDDVGRAENEVRAAVADTVRVRVAAAVVAPVVAALRRRVVPGVPFGVVADLWPVAGDVVVVGQVVPRLTEPDAPVHVVLDVVLDDLVALAGEQVDPVPAGRVVRLAHELVALDEVVVRVLQVEPVDIHRDVVLADSAAGRVVDVEAVAVPLRLDALDDAVLHLVEVHAGREVARVAVLHGDSDASLYANADAVELRRRPGLRSHARPLQRLAAEVDGDVVRARDERVLVAAQVVGEGEVREEDLPALCRLRRSRGRGRGARGGRGGARRARGRGLCRGRARL